MIAVPAPVPPPVSAREVGPAFEPVALARGAHSQAIASLALSEDGTAAFTSDLLHHGRLWPALDGTREPVALPIQTPLAAAVRRAGADLVVAVLDTARGLTVLRVDDRDRLVARVTRTAEPGYEDVVASASGFVARRADQVIEVLGPDASSRGTLAPEPGQRIVSVLHRRGRTLAVVADRDGAYGRWLELDGAVPAWGGTTPKLDIDPATAVLSPDGARLAAVQRRPRRVALVDLATGALTPLAGGGRFPLGFVSDDRVVVGQTELGMSVVEWWDSAGRLRRTVGHDFELDFVAIQPAVTADERVVSFVEHQLVLIAPTGGLRFLGYAVLDAWRVRGSPAGVVAGLGGSSSVLDATLRPLNRLPTPSGILDAALIDDRRVAMLVGAIDTTLDDEWIDPALVDQIKLGRWIDVFDLEDKTNRAKLKLNVRDTRIHYEPATRLLAANGGPKLTFVRFDPAAGKFAKPAIVRLDATVRELGLLDPSLAGGDVAIVATGTRASASVRRISEALSPGDAHVLPGSIEAFDRAGHIYMRDTADSVTIHAADRTLGRLDGLRGWKLRPAPDGTRFAAFGRGRILLASLDGTVRWSIGFPTVSDVQWSPSGDLIVLAGGLARLDAATGAMLGAQCGWRFGIRREPVFNSHNTSACDR